MLKTVGGRTDTGLEVVLSESRLPASSEGLSGSDLGAEWLDDLRCGFAAVGTRTPPMPDELGTKVRLTEGKEGGLKVRCLAGVSGEGSAHEL